MSAKLKVKSLVLYAGYVEDQSYACLLLHNDVGFNSVEEALLDIRKLIIGYVSENAVQSALREHDCPDCECAKDDEVDVEKFMHDAVFGDGQTSRLWEALDPGGWQLGDSDHFEYKNKVTICRADQCIGGLQDERLHTTMVTVTNLKMFKMLRKKDSGR